MLGGIQFRPTVAEIDLSAVDHNIKMMLNLLPEHVEIMAIVKANAYGHGSVPIARQAIQSGATRLGVAFIDEALELRWAGIEAPILVLGYTPPESWGLAQEHDIACTFYEEAQIDEALKRIPVTAAPLKVHLKVETGMNRIGFIQPEAFMRAVHKLSAANQLYFEGVFTHLARADEEDSTYSIEQMNRFDRWLGELEAAHLLPDVIHINNTAGAMLRPKWSRSCIRFGIGMYGLYPSRYVLEEGIIPLKPVLTLKSAIIQLKEVAKGTPISYGGTYVTPDTARIATIPIGYGDGYPRSLSNRGEVLIRGVRAKIAGTICMDQLMVDVTHIPDVEVGDEVVLIGAQGQEQISADELAEWLGTINYEVVTRLSSRIRRQFKY